MSRKKGITEERLRGFFKKREVSIILSTASTTLCLTIIIMLTIIGLQQCTKENPPTPSQETINETCKLHGLQPIGYTIELETGNVIINCKKTINYYNETRTKKFSEYLKKNFGKINNQLWNCTSTCKDKSNEYNINPLLCEKICSTN